MIERDYFCFFRIIPLFNSFCLGSGFLLKDVCTAILERENRLFQHV